MSTPALSARFFVLAHQLAGHIHREIITTAPEAFLDEASVWEGVAHRDPYSAHILPEIASEAWTRADADRLITYHNELATFLYEELSQ